MRKYVVLVACLFLCGCSAPYSGDLGGLVDYGSPVPSEGFIGSGGSVVASGGGLTAGSSGSAMYSENVDSADSDVMDADSSESDNLTYTAEIYDSVKKYLSKYKSGVVTQIIYNGTDINNPVKVSEIEFTIDIKNKAVMYNNILYKYETNEFFKKKKKEWVALKGKYEVPDLRYNKLKC